MSLITLLEDHSIVRDGLRYLLEQDGHRIEAEFGDPDALFRQMDGLKSDILITDLDFANYKFTAILEHPACITERFRTIVLSMHTGPNVVRQAIRLGIAGYVSKGRGAQELLSAVQAVERGQPYFCDEARKAADSRSPHITPRERDVLELLVAGLSPKDVAEKLGISDKTVYVHRINLLEKFKARSMFELQNRARELGIWI